MKAEEFKTKTRDELVKMLLDKRKEQFNLRFQRAGGALDNSSVVRKLRRDVARVKTFLAQHAAGTVAPVKAAAKPKKAAAEKKTTKKASGAKAA